MNLEPKNGWIIGRIAITKPKGTIVAPDHTKGVSKFIVIDAVSARAEAEGFKPGDIVMPETMGTLFLMGGSYARATCPIEKIICKVHGVPISEFVGTDNKPLEQVAAA